ncbi:MAG: LPS export ABC transporter periplasmic protein LptC [Phenylobacterium sp.]
MASIADPLYARAQPRRTPIQAWRRRSRVITGLRVLFPALIALILVGLGASVAWNTVNGQALQGGSANDPIKLVNPRFVGRDTRSRAFVLTALTATRDPNEFQKVYLDRPALVLDDEGPDPLRITARTGVYHEDTGKLEVSGGVRLAGAQGAFESAQSVFDTKTGDLIGSGPVHGQGALGEISAKSYGVYDKGDRMVFKGGVHTVLNAKK